MIIGNYHFFLNLFQAIIICDFMKFRILFITLQCRVFYNIAKIRMAQI